VKVVQLTGLDGFDSLKLVEVDRRPCHRPTSFDQSGSRGDQFRGTRNDEGEISDSKETTFRNGFEAAGIVV
jgi:hypothetical protein